MGVFDTSAGRLYFSIDLGDIEALERLLGWALAAVVVPEVVMVNGHLMDTWKDARLYAGIVGAAVYFWRKDVLFTIVAGMAVYMPLHLGLGW